MLSKKRKVNSGFDFALVVFNFCRKPIAEWYYTHCNACNNCYDKTPFHFLTSEKGKATLWKLAWLSWNIS